MSGKKKATGSQDGGINIKGKEVKIKSHEIVGRDKSTVVSSIDFNASDLKALHEEITTIKRLLASQDDIPESSLVELKSTIDEAENASELPNPKPEIVLQKLKLFQKILETAGGIGSAGLKLMPIVSDAINQLHNILPPHIIQ